MIMPRFDHFTNVVFVCLILAAWMNCSTIAQSQMLDLSQFKREHLITQNLGGNTGELSIYVSFPNWFGNSGYCPVRVRIVPRKGLKFKFNGQLQVVINSTYYNLGTERQVVIDIPIENGNSEATGEILGNFLFESQSRFNNQFTISAKLNGRKLTGQNIHVYSANTASISNGFKSLVLISNESSLHDSNRLEALAEMAQSGNWFSQEKCTDSVLRSGAYGHVEKMPVNWLYLSSLQNVSVGFDDLVRMDAKRLECLNNYVLAGGLLRVNKVPSLQAVATLLPIDGSRQRRTVKGSGMNDDNRDAAKVKKSVNYDSETANLGWSEEHAVWHEGFSESISQTNMDPIYVSHGFGEVCLDNSYRLDRSYLPQAVSSNVPYPNSSISNPSNRTLRFAEGIGDDFWNWLIPSVGRTPVIPFLAFVVLFVGAAAPGIMYWSNRHKRRVWLVVLMPLTAVVCTLLLFTYGLLKDGLGAVSRTRSLAFVDERGDGIVWSRQSYFAATVANDGLMIGEETQFAPMTVSSFADLPACEQHGVEAMQQYRGILLPRMQSQFSMTHPLRELAVVKRGVENDTVLNGPVIVNQSNFTWSKAVFVGPNKEMFIASDVRPGQRAICELSTSEEAISALRTQYKSQALIPPADSPSADQTSLAQAFTGIFTFKRARNNTVGQINEETTWTNHLGMSADNATILLPGTYAIFAAEAPYLERCLKGVRDQDGLHTIVGRW